MLVLANNSVVASVQPDFIYNVINDDTTNGDATNGVSSSAISPLASSAEANDPLFGSQWNLRLINAPTAWNTSRANHKVIVAVLDTGARLTHVDLKNNLAKDKNGNLLAWDATDGSYSIVDGAFVWTGKPLVQCPAYTISPGKGDPQGHGTIVAGVIAAQTNNSVGIAGVSYNADLLPIRVIAQSTSTRELVSAYDYMIKTKAAGYNIRVANISFIVFGISSDSIFHKSIIAANKAGILTVAAAGNNNSGAAVYPSDWPEVLSVVAVDANINRAVYSNYNSSKDLAAPGGGSGSSVLSLGNATDTSYVRDSGTSVAAPHVSAAAAILFALDPSLTPAKAKSLLCSTARDLGAPGYDPYFGYGLLDVNAAVLKVLSGFTATAAPKITAQPVGSVYYAKQAAKALKVVASTSDGGKLTYQWYSNSKNSTAGATAIKGATAASYLPPTTKAGATYYYCVVTNTKANTNPGKKTLRSQIVLLNIAPDFNQQVVMLVPDAQTGLRLEFGGQSVTAGKQASLWASNGGPNQRYYLVRTAGGLYKIKSVNSNLYLTVSGKVAKEGAAIVQAKATGGQEQQFRISYQASGKYTLTSALNPNFVVAVKGASPVSGALIVLQKRNTAAKTQVFRISTIKPVIASGTVVAIQDFNSGRFLDVAKGSKADGASFLTNAPSVALSERYTLTYNAKTGYYKIVPLSSAKPVTIKQAQRYTNGTAVFQYKPISGFNQQWDVRQRSDGKYVVYQPSSRQALTDSGGINH
ncbi:MAG: S8 family serine peptidase, partial [Coriobacteriia bacterium]|nr:S8 family serine peptidase [Coriobacteriia bacterium]